MWLTTAEAAIILGVSRGTVSRWCREGKLPASRPGERALYIDSEDLARFSEAKSRHPHEQFVVDRK
jgi:excisionase family DNA binding protein